MTQPAPRTRDEAAATGSTFYITGAPCRNGHIDKRYTNTGVCYACHRAHHRSDYSRHREKRGARQKSYNQQPLRKSKRAAAGRRWIEQHPEKVADIKRRNKDRHRTKYNESEKIRQRRRRATDPYWRLAKNTSKAVWEAMSGSKRGRHWETVVGYTATDLQHHLEALFKPGMTWENYGSYWHVDHVRPMSWFLSEEWATPNEMIRCAFALTNLQPMEWRENLSKNARYAGGFRSPKRKLHDQHTM